MRVEARRALLIDSVIGFALALTGWMASFYVWGRSEISRPEWGHGPPGRMVASVDPSPWVLPAVTLVALGVAIRRVWPRCVDLRRQGTARRLWTSVSTAAQLGTAARSARADDHGWVSAAALPRPA